MEVGQGYEHAMVGHPSREYLWLLSRTSSLDPIVQASLLEQARTENFDVDCLEYLRH